MFVAASRGAATQPRYLRQEALRVAKTSWNAPSSVDTGTIFHSAIRWDCGGGSGSAHEYFGV